MKKSDLKPFYVVKVNNGYVYLVCQSNYGIVFIRENGWLKLEEFNDSLECNYSDFTISEVYGYGTIGCRCNEISTENRELLWKREKENNKIEDAKEVTIEQIEK